MTRVTSLVFCAQTVGNPPIASGRDDRAAGGRPLEKKPAIEFVLGFRRFPSHLPPPCRHQSTRSVAKMFRKKHATAIALRSRLTCSSQRADVIQS